MTENFLQVFNKYAQSELDSISDYIKHSNKSIRDAQDEFENQFTAMEFGEDWEKVMESNDEEYDKFRHIFPNFFRLCTFAGLFSHFENKLNRLCNFIHERKEFKLKPNDLSGENIIERSRRYLTLVVEIDMDDLNSNWVKITDLQKIRNCFIHNGSNIWGDKNKKLEEQKLYNIVKKYPLLELTPFGIIFILDDQFLIDFTELQKSYLSSLINKVDPKFR